MEEDGDVVFNTDLVRMDISIDNAGRVFKEALDLLAGKMPKCTEGCEFCELMGIGCSVTFYYFLCRLFVVQSIYYILLVN